MLVLYNKYCIFTIAAAMVLTHWILPTYVLRYALPFPFLSPSSHTVGVDSDSQYLGVASTQLNSMRIVRDFVVAFIA